MENEAASAQPLLELVRRPCSKGGRLSAMRMGRGEGGGSRLSEGMLRSTANISTLEGEEGSSEAY